MNKIAIITHSEAAEKLAIRIVASRDDCEMVSAPVDYEMLWTNYRALIFIGALGICVRKIAPLLESKKSDPAVLNIDIEGRFVQSVVSGHVGGANALARELAADLGATPVITTVSDCEQLWLLDVFYKAYGWKMECSGNLTRLMGAFVNRKKTALLLEVRDRGTMFLESEKPDFVDVFYDARQVEPSVYELIIAVTPFLHDFGKKAIFYRPPVLHLGLGCQRDISPDQMEIELLGLLQGRRLSAASVSSAGSVVLKKDEAAFEQLSRKWGIPFYFFESEELAAYQVPNPSDVVEQVSGSASVAEAAAMCLANNDLLVPKVKAKAGDKYFTCAVAFDRSRERRGHVEFVGAGPGDPELISLRGKRFLETADYILYAGSLVPRKLTHYARPGCVVESSAGMDLDTQMQRMKAFYDRGLQVVRLHTGDPCIYGAIQEQMAVMDKWGWSYHITPGISSFQAAAAALRSQFTIPGEVQTIVLTRGEGRTPVPEREKLSRLAQSQSTMCIFLSVELAEKVQTELLEHYPPETPVALCYKLTWDDERIYRCRLDQLAATARENNLRATTLIVVGKAIDNRKGLSKLYHKHFSHGFRNSVKG